MYIPVKAKFLFALSFAILWFSISAYISIPWINDLGDVVGKVLAIIIILLIALLPGFMNAFLVASFLIDTRPKSKPVNEWPGISILLPAHNEANEIEETLTSLERQDYQGEIEIIAIDNNSTDMTLPLLQSLDIPNLIILEEKTKGKNHALNTGFVKAKYDFILTVDADAFLLPNAITEIMRSFKSSPPDTVAVAGSIYVRNSRKNFMTQIQEWDFFHAIAAIKRVQSLFQGTLVAQGAFSLYTKKCINEVGCWSHDVGEDIVLTWGLLEKGYRVNFSEHAIAFINVPETYKIFFYQRSRWARGLIEAFIAHPKILIKPRLTTLIIYWNLLFPAMDTAFAFIFIPGIILAFFGYYFVAGPMTVALLPLGFAMNLILFKGQKRMFKENKLKVRRNFLGFIYYVLFYNIMMVPAVIHGYLSEIFSLKKKWGTK